MSETANSRYSKKITGGKEKYMNKYKIGLVIGACAVITNPLSGQYVLNGLDRAFSVMFSYGAYITLVAGFYFMGLMFWGLWVSREKTNTEPKGKVKVDYIET